MLFNSYVFGLAFLPAVLAGFYLLGRLRGADAAVAWLVLGSLVFYGYWAPPFVLLLAGSIGFNYALGLALGRHRRRSLLLLGIAGNLGLLAYFKYANFFLDQINWLAGSTLTFGAIFLPLGISFFTFQQIAYLFDVRGGEAPERSLVRYALFVSFFPQLIAGPIVHHREMLPQFARPETFRPDAALIALGVTVFVAGLAKKVLLADEIARYATPVFEAAAAGVPLTLVEAWGGALAYTFQIYFDFSGYSDMAIGLGLMFGIRLPLNFNSPYRATNIIEFWRRWHMTLSRFLRDYLYFPLGGNRKGQPRRYANMLVVMLLGGLWHGAAWTFVVWGGLHGIALVATHGWHGLMRRWGLAGRGGRAGRLAAWALTFIFVVVAWVFFRADSFAAAADILAAMAGANGVALPASYQAALGAAGPWLAGLGVRYEEMFLFMGRPQVYALAALAAVALLLPNTQQIFRLTDDGPLVAPGAGRARWFTWRLAPAWAAGLAALTLASLAQMAQPSEFLYFQF